MPPRTRVRRHLAAIAAVVLTAASLSVVGVATSSAAPSDGCDAPGWIAAWTASSQSSSFDRPNGPDDLPRSFRDLTGRMIVSPRYPGQAVRVTLGNRFGPTAVQVGAATIARAVGGGPSLVDGSVRPLTFGGRSAVTIPAGGTVTSDPVAYGVQAFERLAVSFHVVGETPLDIHQWAMKTNFLTEPGSGDHTADVSSRAFGARVSSVLAVTELDVLTEHRAGAVVALGDSITDGIGSTPGADRRWPDLLAHRLLAAGSRLSVVNAGIGGNHVSTDGRVFPAAIGASARQRVAWDALAQDGITDLVVFEGINDISLSASTDVPGLVIEGYRDIIDAAHERGVRVIGATITPAGLNGAKERTRLAINRWIRTSGEFDAVIDLDKAVRDPNRWSHLRPEHDAGFAHLTDAGYTLLASSIDLGVFRGTGC